MDSDKDYLKSTTSPNPEHPEPESTFTILSSNVTADINLGSLGDVSDNMAVTVDNSSIEQHNMAVTVDNTNIDQHTMAVTVDNTNMEQHLKVDGVLSTTQAALLPENLVLVETSKGLILSVADGNTDGISFSNACIATMADEHGRPIISSTCSIPGNIFTQIQPLNSICDSHNSVYETVTDSNMVTSTTIFSDPDSSTKLPPTPQYIVTNTEVYVDSQNNKKKKGGGWPKGKKRKQIPDVQAPRKPMTGYVIFAVKRRQEIKLTNPELTFAEATKQLGQEWSNLSHEQKEKYMQLAGEDKQRYITEMQDFQNSDMYQAFVKNKKLNGDSLKGLGDSDNPLIDLEENNRVNELYCKVCNKYFISIHNKKEHMFGRQHLQNITKEIQKDMEQQADLQKQQMLMATSVVNPHNINGSTDDIDVNIQQFSGETTPGDTCTLSQSSPLDFNDLIQDFTNKNEEREREIKLLRKCKRNYEEDNIAISKEMKVLEEYETKLDHDLGSLKAYGASLSAQIDSLKMVPTLFGVINF